MPKTLELDVKEVISGETLRVQHASGGEATIRVYGVDAPDDDHPCAPFATELARRVTGGKRAAVEVIGRDSRGCIIGRVWAGGEYLGEEISGAAEERPELQRCLEKLRDGDTLVVWRLDRFGRSLKDLVSKMESLDEKEATLSHCPRGLIRPLLRAS